MTASEQESGFEAVAARIGAAGFYTPPRSPRGVQPDEEVEPSQSESEASEGTRQANRGGAGEGAAGGLEADARAMRRRVRELASDSDRLYQAMAQPLNDTGNARRLLIWFGAELLHVRNVGWHLWAGTHWEYEGGDEHARRCAQMVGPLIEAEAEEITATPREEDIIKAAIPARAKLDAGAKMSELTALEKGFLAEADATEKRWRGRKKRRRDFGLSCGNDGRVKAMLACAAPYCTVAIDRLDADPMVLNVKNGTLHFARVESPESGEAPQYELEVMFRAHDRADLITKLAPVVYEPRAGCPVFDGFMERFQAPLERRRFIMRYHGLALTGWLVQALVYHYGGGANGKSVFIEVMARVGGNYVQMLPVESISGDGQRRGDQATPEFARLPGARMVRVSELEKGFKLKEALIKTLTGGEPFLARHLNKGFFEVRPVFKAVLSSNHKPAIYGTDTGIWRRMNIVNWDVTLAADEQRDFEEVVGEMAAEGSGILNRLIEGLADFMRVGLAPPDIVRAATLEHRDDMDPIARFVRDCVEVDGETPIPPKGAERDTWRPPEEVRVYARAMFEAFNRWAHANGITQWKEAGFGLQTGERATGEAGGFPFVRVKDRVRFYAPIRLVNVPDLEPKHSDPGWEPLPGA